ncbi:MAG: sulfite exporter TauE/SafE family protein [Desulfobulbus sp.]|nr:sulfite exporter TauE/SafE family protein [Desulfobulbus sp.]
MDILYTVSGFAVGAIVGLTGVGGGSLMTPLLVLVFGVHPATAVGTDLLYAALTKAGGTATHHRLGHIEWQVTRRLALGSIPAAALTIWILSRLPKGSDVIGQVISHGLGGALLLTAVAILFGRRLRAWADKHEEGSLRQRHLGKITVFVGAALGVLVSISSVGAGALGVAALFFLYPRLSPVRIVGSDVAHAVPLTLVAGLGHWLLGGVNWHLLGALLLGSLPGIWLGARVSARVPEPILRRLLASMLMLIGGKLIFA